MTELGTISARPRGDDAEPAHTGAETLGITVIMPAFNEAPNLAEVVPRTAAVLGALEDDFEILVVDDGSTDGTAEVMAELGKQHPQLRLLRLRRNFGKSTALQAGFERARGDVIVLMDADGQDRPEEIPKLLRALDDGLDLATGRRAQRNDRFIKRHTSRLYNRVTAKVTGVEGEDFNSGLKAMQPRGHEPARALRRAAPLHPGARRSGTASRSARSTSSTPRACTAARSSAARASGAASSTC